MNLIRMNRVYSSLCNSYLVKSRPKRTVDMMEKVLFLMQAESLQKQIPLFHCKIFWMAATSGYLISAIYWQLTKKRSFRQNRDISYFTRDLMSTQKC